MAYGVGTGNGEGSKATRWSSDRQPSDENRKGGRPKGCKNWSTRFQKLMGDEEFLKTIVKGTPKEWQEIVGETPADFIAACLIATVARSSATAMQKGEPLSRDIKDSIALIGKLGFGDKVVMEPENGFFTRPILNFEVVPDRKSLEES